MKNPPRTTELSPKAFAAATDRRANVLDPIHATLDPRVFDHPAAPEPMLKPELQDWLTRTTLEVFARYGYTQPEEWLTGVFTGSLVGFQYSDHSDCDLNLFVDSDKLPDWSRAEMSAIAVNNLDLLKLPATPYEMQVFVQPPGITIQEHFRPGLHAGFIVFGQGAGSWAAPPNREGVHDVQKEMDAAYTAGLLACDKMDLLMRFEPAEAVKYWHEVKDRRRADMQHDQGDYATSNILMKMLENRGLVPS